jgi:hypothetical protein
MRIVHLHGATARGGPMKVAARFSLVSNVEREQSGEREAYDQHRPVRQIQAKKPTVVRDTRLHDIPRIILVQATDDCRPHETVGDRQKRRSQEMQRPAVCANEDRVIALTAASQPSGSFSRGACRPCRSAGFPLIAGSISRSPLRVRSTAVVAFCMEFCGDAATVRTCRPATRASMARPRPLPKRYAQCPRMISLRPLRRGSRAKGSMAESAFCGGRLAAGSPHPSGAVRSVCKVFESRRISQ